MILILALPVSAKPNDLTLTYIQGAPVYYRATSDSTCIGYFSHGTALTVFDQVGEYYRVDCYDMIGYLHADFVLNVSGTYYVNCPANHKAVNTFLERPIGVTITLQRRLYAKAVEQVGVRYLSGGTSAKGFDCSGFTQYIYGLLDISIPRTCDGQLGAGLIIPKENLQCGDLVLFQRTTSYRGISTHVGIYLGDGKLIHAGSKGITIVDLESSYFSQHYLCSRRILVSQKVQWQLPSAAAFISQQ
jgi:hypothetical protein